MNRITKRLFIVLLTIMAYLPMTVVSAMPDVAVPAPTQAMASMDMSSCHHQQSDKSCEHCAQQHTCHCAHSSCSVSLAITAYFPIFSTNQNSKDNYKALRVSTQFQQPTLLFRPPIQI